MAKKTRADKAPEDERTADNPETSKADSDGAAQESAATGEAGESDARLEADAAQDADATPKDTPDTWPEDAAADAADDKSDATEKAQADEPRSDDGADAGEDAGATDTEAHTTPVETAPVPVVQPREPERQSIFLPLFLGGMVAALLGFLLARSEVLDPILPGWLQTSRMDTGLEERLDAAHDRIDDLEAQLGDLPEPAAPAEVDLAPLEDRIATLTDQVEALSNRPVSTGGDETSDALNAALQELRDAANRQQAEISSLIDAANATRADAEQAAQAAQARAVMARIFSALDSGSGYAEDIAALEDAGQTDLPEALTAPAADGVAPLADLQASLPDAARAALRVARREEGGGGLGTFFQQQLGARSVEPREGTDADAVLSRLEAAARAGNLGLALTEAEALSDATREAMADWLARARTRNDAVQAANDVADRLSAL